MKSTTTFRHVASTGSTNEDLLAVFGAGGDPLPLLADHQEDGRGRLGRRWHDDEPAGGPARAMLGSIAQRWDPDDPRLPLVPIAVGLAAWAVLDELALIQPVRLWWPNDLVVDVDGRWRKLGGMLVETAPLGGDSRIGVVAGVGINLAPVGPDAAADIRARAISVAELCDGAPPSNAELFTRLIDVLAATTSRLRADASSVLADYRAVCATIGQPVEVHTSDGPLRGMAAAVTDGGALVVDGPTGRATVTVGDVVPRPV